MIKAEITDGYGTGNSAKVTNDTEESNALIVATRPEKTFVNDIQFFTNKTNGSNMNIDTGASGTPIQIHNGTDTLLWTASDIVGGGKTTFNSADQNHTSGGALSVKVDNSPVGDVFQFAGTDVDLNDYVSLSLWIYVDKDWKSGDVITIYAWDNDLNQQVGIPVDLKTYFDNLNNDVWQELKISLSDMEIETSTTVDALRVRIEASEGKSAKFYMDDIQFEEFGLSENYEIKPNKGEWLYMQEFMLSVAASIPGTLTDATVPYLSYDNLLGTTLPVGITYQREQNGEILFSLTLKGVLDFMQIAGSQITGTGSDGAKMWLTIRVVNIEPLLLKAENEDVLRFIVNDDLSSLLRLRISGGSRREIRKIT